MLFFAALNSGSNGNCYYVGNNDEAVLVDAGISCREIEKRMSRLQLSLDKVKAVCISHEHIDHIRGIETLSAKYRLPVYITENTLGNSRLQLDQDLVRTFTSGGPIQVEQLFIHPFPKSHDAADPFSFVIESRGVRVGVMTDIGKACKTVIHHFRQCHAAFLESNYDDELLENGSYPLHLKKRIKSDSGHLSNLQALEVFIRHKPPYMTHLLLSHLSENNNCPQRVEQLFLKHAGNTQIVVASRYNETELYSIESSSSVPAFKSPVIAEQMSLF